VNSPIIFNLEILNYTNYTLRSVFNCAFSFLKFYNYFCRAMIILRLINYSYALSNISLCIFGTILYVSVKLCCILTSKIFSLDCSNLRSSEILSS
jgi:hypothetical protein